MSAICLNESLPYGSIPSFKKMIDLFLGWNTKPCVSLWLLHTHVSLDFTFICFFLPSPHSHPSLILAGSLPVVKLASLSPFSLQIVHYSLYFLPLLGSLSSFSWFPFQFQVLYTQVHIQTYLDTYMILNLDFACKKWHVDWSCWVWLLAFSSIISTCVGLEGCILPKHRFVSY